MGADLELDSVDVGNGPGLSVGAMKFEFESPAPPLDALEASDAADVAGLYLSASYRGTEFCRVGDFVKHLDPNAIEVDEEGLAKGSDDGDDVDVEAEDLVDPPKRLRPSDWHLLRRYLSQPHVTTFPIDWDRTAERCKSEMVIVSD